VRRCCRWRPKSGSAPIRRQHYGDDHDQQQRDERGAQRAHVPLKPLTRRPNPNHSRARMANTNGVTVRYGLTAVNAVRQDWTMPMARPAAIVATASVVDPPAPRTETRSPETSGRRYPSRPGSTAVARSRQPARLSRTMPRLLHAARDAEHGRDFAVVGQRTHGHAQPGEAEERRGNGGDANAEPRPSSWVPLTRTPPRANAQLVVGRISAWA